jgi:uncharacterized protein
MIHPHTELVWINPAIGHGVRATQPIPRGTLTWVRCRLDRVLTRAEAEALGPPYQAIVERYAYVDHRGHLVLCWDAGRHVNHHCEANSRALGPEAQIALRDIEAGEELTCDYGECNLDEDLRCQCGAPGCRGSIGPEDLWALAPRWDAEVHAAVHAAVAAAQLAQPLLPFCNDPAGVAAILRGALPPPSIVCVTRGPSDPL